MTMFTSGFAASLSASGSRLGIDIGSAAVKVVELSCRRDSYRLDTFALEPVPPGSVVRGSVHDSEAVGAAIRRACQRARTRTRRTTVGVANSEVSVRTLNLDASLDDGALVEAVAREAASQMPFPAEDMAIDFEPLQLALDDPAKVEVHVAACRLEHVARQREAIEHAGLRLHVADVPRYAVVRAVAHIAPAEVPVAVVDIGSATTTMLLVFGDGSVNSQEEPFDLGSSSADKTDLLRLIARLLRVVALSSRTETINQLLLAGGAASSREFAALVADHVRLPVATVNPFARMTVSRRIGSESLVEHAPALLTATGLALRGFVKDGTR
ncbi:MAG: type IV pilus assembly protein PilM [Gammaproteobacteria bacterium]|nr:type IV pilus assembly protein PilM [Gammaproteobacteria bacterium]